MTLTFDLLILFSGHTWRVTWSTPPPGLKVLRLSFLELWVLTSPIEYHWQCVCSHCACAVSRDLCVGGIFHHIFEILDPDFLTGHDISAIWGRILLIFALDKLNVRHISTYGLVDLLIWKVCHVMRTLQWKFPPSLKLIRPSVAYRYCCWYVTWPCDVDIWPFDLVQWLYMAGHVVNPSTKFEDPTAIRSWVMSSDISHRIP